MVRTLHRIRTLSRSHELLVAFVQKDFDTRYAGSVLGVMWTQLYPLLLLVVYSFVFSNVFKNNIPDFPLFLFVGIVIYTFFSTSILLATNSVIANSNLVSKVGFPREVVTISVVLLALIDLVASNVVLAAGAFYYRVEPASSWLALPLIALLLAVFCVGAGLVLATAAVYLRDVRFFVEVGCLILMFLSPVFYPEESVPEQFVWIVHLNPLAVAIAGYRHAFLDGLWPPPTSWLLLIVAGAVAVFCGLEVFDRGQRGFPDAL
jgi:ABC-2 type transport system permease protein